MRSRDSGSTTFEALAAVIILSVVGAAALAAASGGMRAYKAGVEDSAAAARALILDDAIRFAAREVRVPWWERRSRLERDAGVAKIAYWDGLPDKSLTIQGTDSGLALTTPAVSRVFPGVTLVDVEPLPDGDAPPRGIRVYYRILGRSFSTAAEFGAWAIPGASP